MAQQCLKLKLLFILGYILPVFSSAVPIEEIRRAALEHMDTKVPPPTEEKPVTVGLSLTLNYFTIEEIEHVFIVNAWIRMTWKDPRLSWDVGNSTNRTSTLRYGMHEIWHPDITLYNNAFPTDVDHYGDTHAIVSSDGTVIWVPPARLAVNCDLDLIRWPYDKHVCAMKFGSWTYGGDELDLDYQNENATFDDMIEHQLFVKNSEWNLVTSTAKKNTVTYTCCPEPYVDITFRFVVERRSPSYAACLILPIIMISIINTMVFLLPPTAGEKIILGSINSFIICIFLLYFQEKLPPLGDHLPLLVILYACNLVLVGISLVVSVAVLNLSRNRRASSPPQCFRIFCNTNFAQLLGLGHIVPFVSSTHSRLDEGVEMVSPHENHRTRLDVNGEKEDQLVNLVEYDTPYMANAEWILLAAMVDRLTLIVYSIVSGIILGLCLA